MHDVITIDRTVNFMTSISLIFYAHQILIAKHHRKFDVNELRVYDRLLLNFMAAPDFFAKSFREVADDYNKKRHDSLVRAIETLCEQHSKLYNILYKSAKLGNMCERVAMTALPFTLMMETTQELTDDEYEMASKEFKRCLEQKGFKCENYLKNAYVLNISW